MLIIKSINSNLLVPRYIIFIVPLILIIVIKNIENLILIKKKSHKFFFIYAIIFFSITTTFYKINNRPIPKPPTNDLITIISRSQVKIISSEDLLFGNYLKTHYLFKKNNLKFLNYEEINHINTGIWFICTNNMRAHTSLENLKDYRFVECVSQNLEIEMQVIDEFNIQDFQGRLYVKK